MKSRTTLVMVSVAIALVVVAGVVSANSFFSGHKMPFIGTFGINKTEMQAVQDAIKNNDYDAWKSAIESQLTQDNFNKLVQMSQNLTYMNIRNFSGNFTRTAGGKHFTRMPMRMPRARMMNSTA